MSGTLPLFDDSNPFQTELRDQVKHLAKRNVFIGTSSWKYAGWLGQIYSAERYTLRGRFSKTRFERECLTEYAETFPTVCGDFAFYQFPTPDFWKKLFDSANNLRFSLKVPEEITVPAFPHHPRYGARSGLSNPTFLDTALFQDQFLVPLQRYASQLGVLIFEFGAICGNTFTVTEFLDKLGAFLSGLPATFHYAVEIRNPEFLHSGYLQMLRGKRVTHVLNAWSRMPDLAEQVKNPDVFTTDLVVVRALLKKGRKYEEAVRRFSPYREIQERDHVTRQAINNILQRSIRRGGTVFLYINNRLEGNAPNSIHEILLDTQV